jgi:hypothetical protein
VEDSLLTEAPRLLVVNKFGKIEADGGGLRAAIALAVDSAIPVLVGVPARNLARWRAFAGELAVELPAETAALESWLRSQGLGAPSRNALEAALAA